MTPKKTLTIFAKLVRVLLAILAVFVCVLAVVRYDDCQANGGRWVQGLILYECLPK